MNHRYIKIYLFNLFLILVSVGANAQIDKGTDFDLQGYIDKKIARGDKEIVIPPGRYRVQPSGNSHITLNNLSNVTIYAQDVELICTETVKAITIKNCRNVKLSGLHVDYDPLPFTQGKIVGMSADKTVLTVDIIDGYSTKLRNDKLEIYDEKSGELITRTYYSVTYSVDEENRRVIFTKKRQANPAYSFEEVGDIVVFDSFNNIFSPHAVVLENSENLVMENVKVFAGPTFAFFEKNCSGSKYIGCEVDRRPLEDEIVPRGVRRMRSNNADGFHSKSAQIGPSYIHCLVRYNGDDGFAISGQYHVITETNNKIITVVGKGGMMPDIQINDPVELVSYDGTRLPDAKVLSIKQGRPLNSKEKEFLGKQKFLAESGKTKNATHVYKIEVDRQVTLPMGSVIASANRLGNNFEIINCIAGPNRSRGIIAKGSNGTIKGNKLISNWGMAIKCSPEHQWLEAGSGNNLVITNNTIVGCHDVAIAVYAFGGNGEVGSHGAHSNIKINNNTVSNSLNPAFAITSTTGLTFLNNTVNSPNPSFYEPWKSTFGRKDDPNRQLYLEKVIEITENFETK